MAGQEGTMTEEEETRRGTEQTEGEEHLAEEEQDGEVRSAQEELVFFNDDGSFQTAVVGRDLRASDLCQLLALKNRVAKDVNWTLVEHWVDFGLERNLEDHEEVLAAHWDMQCSFGRRAEKRFVFRKDFRKYEFFHNPQVRDSPPPRRLSQFFPADMVDMSRCEELTGVPASDHATALQVSPRCTCDAPTKNNVAGKKGSDVCVYVYVSVRQQNHIINNKTT
ncbi:Growth factor receptor-bound protein 10 [Gryllus bimaculatus]|nr:Growth factor receptor-bound protein 10 [Gryllus bimaculatus]